MKQQGTTKVHQGQLVAQYRKCKNMSQQELVDAMKVSLRTVQRLERMQVIKNRKRREFLVGFLGIPASLMGIEQETLPFKKSALIVNQDRMAFLEETLVTRWEVYRMGGPRHAAFGLDTFLQEVTGCATLAQGTAWHYRAQALLSSGRQLEGSVYGDKDYTSAHAALQTAYSIAYEIDDRELMAAARTREGVIFFREDSLKDAASYLNSALTIIRNSHGFSRLRGYILGVLSEVYARMQRQQESLRCVGLAERTLEEQEPMLARSHLVFDDSAVRAVKATNVLLLGDYDRALMLIQKGLGKYTPTSIPGRAKLLAQESEAHYGLKQIDECTISALEAWTLAQSVGSSRITTRIEQLHNRLLQSRWKKEAGVIRLGLTLAP
jgi:transcriptional regulator with XRE-family HTH domain